MSRKVTHAVTLDEASFRPFLDALAKEHVSAAYGHTNAPPAFKYTAKIYVKENEVISCRIIYEDAPKEADDAQQ